MSFRRGQWVYVHPDERSAPRDLRGRAGTVTKVTGDRAIVAFRCDGDMKPVELEMSLLHLERRRRDRPPAQWSSAVARSA